MKNRAEKKEARSDQVINLDQYQQAVLRDILYLLNTCNMQAETMGDWPNWKCTLFYIKLWYPSPFWY